jgi:hypothetical protein
MRLPIGVGCAGEVRVARSEEGFDKWGIEILVSYRDGDNLAILTGSHQSGGVSVAPRSSRVVRTLLMPSQERSLATVTYLMSLSEMARTPFSLVDEINQVSEPCLCQTPRTSASAET